MIHQEEKNQLPETVPESQSKTKKCSKFTTGSKVQRQATESGRKYLLCVCLSKDPYTEYINNIYISQ